MLYRIWDSRIRLLLYIEIREHIIATIMNIESKNISDNIIMNIEAKNYDIMGNFKYRNSVSLLFVAPRSIRAIVL